MVPITPARCPNCQPDVLCTRCRVELHSLSRGIPMGLDLVSDHELESRGLVICTRRETPTQTSRYQITATGVKLLVATTDACRIAHCTCKATAVLQEKTDDP